ncbi:hypothetical protein CFE70_004724 [Pyrenophora teres f. teres 0-1]
MAPQEESPTPREPAPNQNEDGTAAMVQSKPDESELSPRREIKILLESHRWNRTVLKIFRLWNGPRLQTEAHNGWPQEWINRLNIHYPPLGV